jgi:hypothetical protein
MNEQLLAWVGLAVLLVLCLPITAIAKLLLEVTAWAVRLALVALVAGAAYLSVFPNQLPAEIAAALSDFPRLRNILPDPGAPHFAACAVGLVAAVALPLLAVLDVTRKLAGRPLRRLRLLTLAPVAAATPAPPLPVAAPTPSPAGDRLVLRRVDRRSAADTFAVLAARPTRRDDE